MYCSAAADDPTATDRGFETTFHEMPGESRFGDATKQAAPVKKAELAQEPVKRQEIPPEPNYLNPRVLELTYTAVDMADFAKDFGLPPIQEPYGWDEARRNTLKAELDAIFARLYGLTKKD
nr:hypothetical protein [Candidatus Sigynarchaeota archaeon]